MNDKWYLARPGGAAVGPLRTDLLVRRIREGTVSRDALVWCQGMDKWLPLGSVQQLADAVRIEAVAPRVMAPRPSAQALSSPTLDPGVPSTTREQRGPFGEEDAEERTELALPDSSAPTILRDVHTSREATLAIAPHDQAHRGSDAAGVEALGESWAWQAAGVPQNAYELPDSATQIVNPKGVEFQATLPAAGISSDVVLNAAKPIARGSIATREPLPAKAVEPQGGSAAVAASYLAISSESPEEGDERPPPYPTGFPGPDAGPPPAAPTDPSPVERGAMAEPIVHPPESVHLPMTKSNTGTRLAVALVFILGLALGIFGARRVVMMQRATPTPAADEKAETPR